MGIFKDLNCKISFGGAAISGEGGGYGFGEISEENALSLLKEAFDLGIRVFDTAPIYGFGTSEKRMGKAFKGMRDKVVLVSKSGVSWHSTKRVNMTNDPKETERMLHQSLKDLQTDYIDLYMIHWPDKNVDIRRPMEVLAKAKHQGKIKHIGLCNTFKEDYQKAKEVERVEVLQSELNLFNRKAIDDLFPIVREDHLSFMSWGTLDKGILTGRVTRDRKYGKADARSWAPWWKKSNLLEKIERVEKIKPLLEKRGHTLLEFALSHNLMLEEVSTVICGARNPDQLHTLLKALENPVPKELIEECVNHE